MKVGFIGSETWAPPWRTNLIKAGHDLQVYNRSPDKSAALVALGARKATTVADAGSAQVVVHQCSRTTPPCPEIVFAPGGLIHSMSANAIHISIEHDQCCTFQAIVRGHANAGSATSARPFSAVPTWPPWESSS